MTILNATEARSRLYQLIQEVAITHEPVVITGKKGNAVLIAEEDWNAISETLYLLAIPGMRESIQAGRAEPLADCAQDLEW
jgi:antitoxin YefM